MVALALFYASFVEFRKDAFMLIPNKETIEAMIEARRGELASFESIDALMANLKD